MAADVYLAIHYYFWPQLLNRPADIKEPAYLDKMQKACNAEVRPSLQSSVRACNLALPARVPHGD